MKNYIPALIALLASIVMSSANASIIVENGDAGETLTEAQIIIGGIDFITGNIDNDADLFRFYWSGGGFYADTTGSDFDTQLFLFDELGAGLLGNDDISTNNQDAYLEAGSLDAGLYFIGISGFDYDPCYTDPCGINQIFKDLPLDGLHSASLNSTTLASWNGLSVAATGSYTINFQQPIIDIPEPTTFAMMALGLAGLFFRKNGV